MATHLYFEITKKIYLKFKKQTFQTSNVLHHQQEIIKMNCEHNTVKTVAKFRLIPLEKREMPHYPPTWGW